MAKLSIRIDLTPDGRIGPGKVLLLERIAEHGSIAAAGRSMGMSYRRAWELVAEINGIFGAPAVEAQIGGRNGGNARLTELGLEIVRRYRALETETGLIAAGNLRALQAIADRSKSPRRTRSAG